MSAKHVATDSSQFNTMFASSGLFGALPCPYLPTCPREAYCIYSHSVTPNPAAPPPAPTAATQPVSKRKLDPANKDPVDAPPTKQIRNEKGIPDQAKRTPIAAMEVAKQRRQTYDTVAPPVSSSSSSSSKRPGSTAAEAVLLARPQVAKAATPAPKPKVEYLIAYHSDRKELVITYRKCSK